MKTADQEKFLNAIKEYASALEKFKLVCQNTQKILKRIKTCPEILAVKGCGAMGADVILAVINTHHKQNFYEWAHKEKFNVVFCDNQFASGVV
jgi:hypothetical protein